MSGRVEHIGDAPRITAIYALCDYPSWEPRYIGKTVQYIHERHKAHIRAAKRGRGLPVYFWIRKQIKSGARLAVKLIEYVQPGEDWAERERHWIEFYRPGGRLLNLTSGGEGLSGHRLSAEHASKIAAALRTGAHFDCERCGSRFWRKANEIAKRENRFCSRACSNRRNIPRGIFDAP